MQKQLLPILDEYRASEGNLITLLQDIQAEFGYVPEEAVEWFSRELDIPASRFYGVTTFYSQFYLKKRGKNIVTACCGTACHVKGSERLIDGLRKELGLPENEDTTQDMSFTLEKVNCVGACSIAPVIIINKKVHGKASSDKLLKEIRSMKRLESEEK
jgi:NADH:ubiquinone oxidoreductase subunit E